MEIIWTILLSVYFLVAFLVWVIGINALEDEIKIHRETFPCIIIIGLFWPLMFLVFYLSRKGQRK